MSGYQIKEGLTSFQRWTMGTSPRLVWTHIIPFSAATQCLTQCFLYPSFSAPSFSSHRNHPSTLIQHILSSPSHSPFPWDVPYPGTRCKPGLYTGNMNLSWPPPCSGITVLPGFCPQIKGDSSQVEQHNHHQARSQHAIQLPKSCCWFQPLLLPLGTMTLAGRNSLNKVCSPFDVSSSHQWQWELCTGNTSTSTRAPILSTKDCMIFIFTLQQ